MKFYKGSFPFEWRCDDAGTNDQRQNHERT